MTHQETKRLVLVLCKSRRYYRDMLPTTTSGWKRQELHASITRINAELNLIRGY